MSISEYISPLVGRLVLAWFFLSEAFARLAGFNGTVTLLEMQHIPAAPILLIVALTAMVLGALSVALGFYARHGAMVLFAFTIVVSVLMHAYWQIQNPIDRAADYDIFVRNMAIAGGLLLIVGMGPGAFSVDNTKKKRR